MSKYYREVILKLNIFCLLFNEPVQLNKFFDPSTPSLRKGRVGGNGGEKNGKKNGEKKEEKTDENSGHYAIASSRPPERRPLERRTLIPTFEISHKIFTTFISLVSFDSVFQNTKEPELDSYLDLSMNTVYHCSKK